MLVSLLLVNLVRLLARVRFSHWRHIASAYLVFFLMAVAIEMIMGDHPFDPYKASIYGAGVFIAAMIELLFLGLRDRGA